MRIRSAFLAMTLLSSPAFAGDQLIFGPTAPWIVPQQIPTAPAASDGAPITFLLSDSQAKLEPGQSTNYVHVAVRINNAQGLAAGNVAAGWDPAFDTVTVHRLILHRGAQSIDILASGQKFTTLRREKDLEQQTLNGQLTATLQPEGIQVGDIIESEMSIVRRDPTMRGHMELAGGFASPLRVERASVRLVTPAKSMLRQRGSASMPVATIERKNGQQISTWTISPLIPEAGPAFAPDRFAAGKTIELSDFQSWSDLAALFVPLFDAASTIPSTSPLQQEIARIKATSPDVARRAILALQLVQDKVRYVNLALGVGGLVPAGTDLTWQRRFGDCKAKTALLTGLLRELGIDATPVLVHTENGDGLDERLPLVGEFNHVLVRATIGGKAYWLDGTRTGDTSLATLPVPFYHWGLPIAREAKLVKIQPAPRDTPDVETIIRTDASAGAFSPVPTTIDLVFHGDYALAENQLLSSVDSNVRDEAIRSVLNRTLDRFEITKATSSFDADKQEYRLHGEGRQTLDLDRGLYWTEVRSPGYKADFRRTGTRDKDAPVAIGYPSFNRTVQTIVIPKDRVSRTTFQMAPLSATVAGVEYRRNVTNSAGVVTIESTSRSLVPEIPYAEALASEARLRELDKDNIWIRFSDSAPVAASAIKELIGREAKTADDYYQAATKLLEAGRASESLGALDKAVTLAPAKSDYRILRAQLRMVAGDPVGAEEDAVAGAKVDPKSVPLRNLLAAIYWKNGKAEAAYAQAKSLETVDNPTAQVALGQLMVTLGHPREAIAAYDRALAFDKDAMTHVLKAQALSNSDKGARLRELEAGIKLNPPDESSLVGLAGLASQLGDHGRAVQLLDQAFLKSPDSISIRGKRAVQLALAGKVDAANREFEALDAKDLSAIDLNNLCWDKALGNVALDRALEECNRSLAKSDSFATHDSKGLVLLRQSRPDEAIVEFNMALKERDVPASLYARGLAFARKGDRAKAEADFAKALTLEPGTGRFYDNWGLTPQPPL